MTPGRRRPYTFDMGRYESSGHVDAPPERVFEVFVDPRRIPSWAEVAEVRATAATLRDAGTRFRMVVRGAWPFDGEVLRSDPPCFHDQRGLGPLGASYRWRASFEPAAGGTDVRLDTEYRLPLGPIGALADVVLGGFIRRAGNATWARMLARLSEMSRIAAEEAGKGGR